MLSKNILTKTRRFANQANINQKYSLNSMYSITGLSRFSFSTGLAKERSFGGLKDQDRIFTNLYKDGDPFIDGALRRVIKFSLINIIG
jgi:hypothetical protein